MRNDDDRSYERYKQNRRNKYRYEQEQITIPIAIIVGGAILMSLWRYILIAIAAVLVVAILLALIFLDSKKTYTVQFDLNGGTLLGGSLEQRVLHGHDAVPPNATKEGAYLHGWSTSYRRVTRDIVVEAVWEYETTAGIIYSDSERSAVLEALGQAVENTEVEVINE